MLTEEYCLIKLIPIKAPNRGNVKAELWRSNNNYNTDKMGVLPIARGSRSESKIEALAGTGNKQN
jgi:hypothetical protein